MNIYGVRDTSSAQDVLQLLKLNSECAKLHWSRKISVPSNITDALSVIEMFVETKIKEICGNPINILSDSEEDAILNLIKRYPNLRATLGTGVIMRGSQADEIISVIKSQGKYDKLLSAIESGLNIVVF